MSATKPNRARSPRIKRGTVSVPLAEWLGSLNLAGVEAVKAQLALALAAELDDDEAPRYARPRVAAELRATLAEITRVAADDARAGRDVARILEEVA